MSVSIIDPASSGCRHFGILYGRCLDFKRSLVLGYIVVRVLDIGRRKYSLINADLLIIVGSDIGQPC